MWSVGCAVLETSPTTAGTPGHCQLPTSPNFSGSSPHACCLSVTVFGWTGNCGTAQQEGEGVKSKKGESRGVKTAR